MTKFGKMLLLGAVGIACSVTTSQVFAAKSYVGDYTVGNGAVELYGHSIDPNKVKLDDKQYYPWLKLKDFLPELLPDAKKQSMPADKFCDHIVLLSELYAMEAEKAEEFLTAELERVYPDESPFKGEPLRFGLSDRLISSSSKGVMEIIDIMPGYEEKIFLTQDIVRKHQAMLYVHDASLMVCSEHASSKGYLPLLSYDGPDKDYDPEKDPAWDEFKKKIKDESAN